MLWPFVARGLEGDASEEATYEQQSETRRCTTTSLRLCRLLRSMLTALLDRDYIACACLVLAGEQNSMDRHGQDLQAIQWNTVDERN